MGKVKNFFQSVPDLKLLTYGSKYFSIRGIDVALTNNQNIFIKLPPNIERENHPYLIDKTINYIVEEGFVPKALEKKKVHVWVYN